MATFAELEATNPQIRVQFREWLDLCEETDDDFTDYQAFRQHVIFRGSPDPGDEPIEDFLTPDGVPNEDTWAHARSRSGPATRSEEADASASARPISDAEAAQLGSTGALGYRPIGTEMTDRNEHSVDVRGGVTSHTSDDSAAPAAPPAEMPPAPPRVPPPPVPAASAPVASTRAAPANSAPRPEPAPTGDATSNGTTATLGAGAHSASWEVASAGHDGGQWTSMFSGSGWLRPAAVLLFLLGLAAGAWWLIERRRRAERNRITSRARHLTSAAASHTAEAAEAIAEAATVAGRRSREIGATIAAEGERLLKQTTRAARDVLDTR